MANKCGSKRYIFQEAVDHCRWKTILSNDILAKPELQERNLHQYSDRTFDEIILFVYNICVNIKGIGMLTIYDIASAICRFNKINIEKVYIIGKGPKRAIRLLNITPKIHKIQKLSLKYVEISELLQAFSDKKYEINAQMINSNNGDAFETYICNWQKNQ